MKKSLWPILALTAIGFGAASSARQDLEPSMQIIREQWGRSPHAMSMDTEDERKSMNTPDCAHCHTAQGYWEVILEGRESSAPYENPNGLTCITCHFPTKIASGDGALRTEKPESACTGCHDILVQNDPHGFSSCLQGSMLAGRGGALFNEEEDRSGAHKDIPGGCVGCHMAPSPEGEYMYLLGGHSFQVITKGRVGRHLNPAGCRSCHEGIDLESIEKSQQSIRDLMAELESMLPHFYEKTSGQKMPKLPRDPSLTETQSKASFNYYFILKDGTWGIHNPVYIPKLLRDSISALKSQEK